MPVLLMVLLSAPLPTMSGSSALTQAPLAAKATGGPFDYIVIIVMENQGINSILGNSAAPYLNRLDHMYSLAKHYSAIDHPSLPNYLALVGGSTFDCGGYDGNPNSNSCTSSAWGSPNLVDSLANSGSYYVRHDPFVYFNDIANNQARCNRVVPAGIGDSALLNDLGSNSTYSNFMWLTPDACNDMHDCGISTGDTYLSTLVPEILNSNLFTTQKAILFITFDEGNSHTPNDNVYTVWAGTAAKTNYKSSNFYTHYSLPKTLERAWGLAALTSHDAGASAMGEFLTSEFPKAAPQSTAINFAPIAALAAGVAIAIIILIVAVWQERKMGREELPILFC